MSTETAQTQPKHGDTSMTTQHTPGPWAYRISSTGDSAYINRQTPTHDGGTFCNLVSLHWTEEARATLRANARLIAAAPELLEALQTIPDCPDDWEDGHNPDAAQAYADAIAEWAIGARAAIAKALNDAEFVPPQMRGGEA